MSETFDLMAQLTGDRPRCEQHSQYLPCGHIECREEGHGTSARAYPDRSPNVVGEGDEQESRPRSLLLRPASGIRIRPVRWLWDTTPEGAPPTSHGRIPLHSLAIAAGGPGLGKSQFAVWMTARITTGTLPGELYGKPRPVIYAAAEDSWSFTIAPRLLAAGANMEMVFHVSVRDEERIYARLTLPIDTSLLAKEAERHSVALLVMDPLLSYIDKGINDYRAAEVRQALEPLVEAADRHRFTILGLAHFTHRQGDSQAGGQRHHDRDQDDQQPVHRLLQRNASGHHGGVPSLGEEPARASTDAHLTEDGRKRNTRPLTGGQQPV